MKDNENNEKKGTGYIKDVLNSVLFMILIIIGMIVLAHFRP